jgi:hypothetical protein|tara:strand:+ start:194 stop:619 length:426 start_codon:yes stop_codon:yes gene_type:complete
MADFTLLIRERVMLEGTERGSDYNLTISGITNADNRIVTVPSGSVTEIFKYDGLPGAGTFETGSFKYGRISNYSTSVPVNLKVSSSSELMNFSISAGGSFMLSTSDITGSVSNTFVYDDIVSVSVEPSGSNAKIEYFIATT